jgi:hypothetical protein
MSYYGLELDDLATSVFEEAHEMIRVEKEGQQAWMSRCDKMAVVTRCDKGLLMASVTKRDTVLCVL